MAISANYITLQQQIADELGDRQDLLTPLSDSSLTLSPIQNAIQSAISTWEREPFYFNEYYADAIANPGWTFATVEGQEFYTTSGDTANLLANSPSLVKLHILIDNNRYPLWPRTWQYMEDTSVNPNVTGMPIDYAYFAETLRLYRSSIALRTATVSKVSNHGTAYWSWSSATFASGCCARHCFISGKS
jgi:hypothetical protein